jgi:hypothetical protein
LYKETARQSDWDNVITCHQGNMKARTWRYAKKCIGKHTLHTRGNDEGKRVSATVSLHRLFPQFLFCVWLKVYN